jgi:transaldolase / glucose-6-phosphate isomerase
MKDAGIEAKPSPPELTANLGNLDAAVRGTLAQADAQDVIRRIWAKDASLWKQEEAHQKIIRNSLGWLTAPQELLDDAGAIEAFAKSIRESGEFAHFMVCGMGGSSLCPEVLRQTFGRHEGFPVPLVLDSTDPDTIRNFANQIDVTRCLFGIASKSGTTTEPVAFHRYWYHEVEQKLSDPGSRFIAITDPKTLMAETAAEEKFRQIFLNQPDIGGRYSALSYFGMVPAALMGLDIRELLSRALHMTRSCGPEMSASQNPAALLGAAMAEGALAGRDKLTFVMDGKLSALGLWIEQLVAESTGKEGKGIVPVAGEPLGPPEEYGHDRLFVSISSGAISESTAESLRALENAGHPVIYRRLPALDDLGAEFFLWELATAFCGWRLAINPFDQPNVQESKDMTKAILEKFVETGKLDEPAPTAQEGVLKVYSDKGNGGGSVNKVLADHLATIKPNDYVAILAYVEESPEMDAALQKLRLALREMTGCAVTTGYGPRFLHSTGQLHKGGPDTGVFIQLTAPDKVDFDVPGAPYSFSVLIRAQAQGDLAALLAHGRRALRVDVGEEAIAGIGKLTDSFEGIDLEKGKIH